MHSQGTTAAIILAAGSSSRMSNGQHKLLLPLGGRPVLLHVIETALSSQAKPIILVLGHQAAQIRSLITVSFNDQDLSIRENPDYREGMSTSLHMGLRALTAITNKNNHQASDVPDSTINSTVILLGDQPLLTASIIDTLIATRQTTSKPIIVPLYNGKRGNPVLFDARFFPELMEVTGDEGGRSVIMRHPQDVVTVEQGDATASYDIDTWEAYQQVVAEWQRTQK
jgi:molybdenum cofactor cytidylyltransferase